MALSTRPYLAFKFFNTGFAGLTAGAIFTIYAPLPPSFFSVGGILLALAILVVARFYDRLLNLHSFYRFSLTVELVMLGLIFLFLLFPQGQHTALFIYVGYQLTFAFGSYLVRAETMAFRKKKMLGWIDGWKQAGYLAGLGVGWLYYAGLERFWGIRENQEQVYDLHWLLLGWQGVTLFLLVKAFTGRGVIRRL